MKDGELAIEISEFYVSYESRRALKEQTLADFIVETTSEEINTLSW